MYIWKIRDVFIFHYFIPQKIIIILEQIWNTSLFPYGIHLLLF